MEFIDLSYPASDAQARSRRKVRSHAARAAHARIRKLQTAQYQSSSLGQSERARQNTAHHHRDEDKPESGCGLKWPPFRSQCLIHPTPTSLLGSGRTDPFASFAMVFSRWEKYLFDHCEYDPCNWWLIPRGQRGELIHRLDVDYLIPYFMLNCTVLRGIGSESMRENWVKLAITDAGMLNGILLAACRHLSIVYPERPHIEQSIFSYKAYSLRDLNDDLKSQHMPLSDLTVSKALILALDEVYSQACGI